jgi:hypothetical protein
VENIKTFGKIGKNHRYVCKIRKGKTAFYFAKKGLTRALKYALIFETVEEEVKPKRRRVREPGVGESPDAVAADKWASEGATQRRYAEYAATFPRVKGFERARFCAKQGGTAG